VARRSCSRIVCAGLRYFSPKWLPSTLLTRSFAQI